MKKEIAYGVKEWFADKVSNEVKMNIKMCDVFAVLKETDKAVYAMLNIGADKRKCMWVPKSVLIEYVPGEQENGEHKYETIFEEDYDECVRLFKEHWNMFK